MENIKKEFEQIEKEKQSCETVKKIENLIEKKKGQKFVMKNRYE